MIKIQKFNRFIFHISYFISHIYLLTSCDTKTQFTRLKADQTNIKFVNELIIEDTMNILDKEFVYNGAGVAVGDWNGDGLQDVFFTANMNDNALYLNKGDMHFEDVTKQSGTSKPIKCWSSGATMVDINEDGKQDLYVSNLLHGNPEMRRNLLYVNQGNNKNGVPVFKEQAKEYGLSPDTYSAQTVFFDYDNDGDLDAYILVNVMDMQFANQYMSIPLRAESITADLILRNDFDTKLGHAVFTDVSKQAKIQKQGYGHGVSVMDINKDGWLDVYVSNDYLSNDNMFINNHDGTFRDIAEQCFKHQSWSAMGNDVADINNDGLLDMISMDMQPSYNERKKSFVHAASYNHYTFTEQYQYGYQFARNALQLNRGMDTKTGNPCFSDVGMLANVHETDWSWCPLWLDADNDGNRDLLVTNGFPKDITDQDFLAFRNEMSSITASKADLYRMMPEIKIPNYLFKNNGNLNFQDHTKESGMDVSTFSNGAVYADFDNDGDLDVVINNINDLAHVYRNNTNEQENKPNYLRIELLGTKSNPYGIGAKVEMFADTLREYAEQNIVRGYLSTSERFLHFGLGQKNKIDSVRVIWPDGRFEVIKNPKTNQVLKIKHNPRQPNYVTPKAKPAIFEEVAAEHDLVYKHIEANFVDFNVQKTIPHQYSQSGPSIAVGDIDGNGLEDFYLGGSSKVEGTFFFQQSNGKFRQETQNLKTSYQKREEDTGVLFFDSDGDNDLDLYCVRGSYQHEPNAKYLQDALFLNDGKGHFELDSLALPKETANGSVVRAIDYDRDGDLDLFVGGRVTPRQYPKADRSFILRNESSHGSLVVGRGNKVKNHIENLSGLNTQDLRPKFTDVTAQVCPELLNAGMVADAIWTDYDKDGWPDLLIAAEFQPLKFLKNNKGQSLNIKHSTLNNQLGWWNSLAAADFDNDGDTDYMAGNYGLNIAHKATADEPLSVYAKDFDDNGSFDAVIAQYGNSAKGGRNLYPFHTRDDLVKQSLIFRKRFLKYSDLGEATFDKVLTSDDLKGAMSLTTNWLQSSYIENVGNGQFKLSPLPIEAQIAPIFGMLPVDVDNDGLIDVLLVGNDYGMELIQGRADAFYGLMLKNLGKGKFKTVNMNESGFNVPNDARAIAKVKLANGQSLFIATQNRGNLKVFKTKSY
jgi:enediyne biosynthesis protein E4